MKRINYKVPPYVIHLLVVSIVVAALSILMQVALPAYSTPAMPFIVLFFLRRPLAVRRGIHGHLPHLFHQRNLYSQKGELPLAEVEGCGEAEPYRNGKR